MSEFAGRITIFGVTFDNFAEHEVVEFVVESLTAGEGGWIVTPNVDFVRQVKANPELGALIESATLAVVDGAPLQWTGRVAGLGKIKRAPGASLVVPLARAAASLDVPVLLLGGRPGASATAAANLSEMVPGLRVFEYSPPFGFERDPRQLAEVAQAVHQSAGGIVFCGFGFPKQERLMWELVAEFPDTWFAGVGGSIDFLAGYVPRAPRWVQKVGFEWLFRLLMEPRRLARRYLVHGVPTAAQILGWALRERWSGVGAATPVAEIESAQPNTVRPELPAVRDSAAA